MLRRVIGAIALGATTIAACGGAAAETTTTGPTPTTATTVVEGPLVFGEGSLPETVPDGFPIPGGARIGSTLQDTETGRTEVVMVVPADVATTVGYFEESLPTAGYDIVRSEQEGLSHVIEFTGDDATGVISVGGGASNAATVALVLTPTP